MDRIARDGSTFASRTVSASQVSSGLAGRVREQIGDAAFGMDGRLIDWRSSLLPATLNCLEDRHLTTLDPGRRRVPEAGAVIALNSFLPWEQHSGDLRLADLSSVDKLTFDARCPTGVRGTPPHLDMIAARGQSIVAATARGPGYLGRRFAGLAAAYDSVEVPPAMRPWHEILPLLRQSGRTFAHVDAASLLKFALGLARTFPNHDLTLLYLYWEPSDAGQFEAFRRHRRELDDLSDRVEGSAVRLRSQTFGSLWNEWEEQPDKPWLRELVAQLRGRYDMAIGEQAAL